MPDESPSNPAPDKSVKPVADFDYVTTDELIGEIARRFSGVLIATLHSKNNDTETFQVAYRGGFTQAYGMAHRTLRSMHARSMQSDCELPGDRNKED